MPSPITASILRSAAAALEAEGFAVSFDEDDEVLVAILPTSADEGSMWMLRTADHPVLGPGALARLVLPRPMGVLRAAWLANALNLSEAADWSGEDRPHALGAWTVDDGRLGHNAFFPAVLLGGGDENAAVLPRPQPRGLGRRPGPVRRGAAAVAGGGGGVPLPG